MGPCIANNLSKTTFYYRLQHQTTMVKMEREGGLAFWWATWWYSHHIECEGHCSTNDHNCIHDVPNLSQIAALVKYYARVYHLKWYATNHPVPSAVD